MKTREKLSDKDIKTLYFVKHNTNKMIERDITVDILTYLVAYKLMNDKKESRPKGNRKMFYLSVIIAIIVICTFIFGFFKNNENDENEKYKTVKDPSIFSTVNYFGKDDLIHTLIGRITRIISLIQKKNSKLLNCKISPAKKNFLLYGEPGTGKTLLVKKLAFLLDQNLKLLQLKKQKINISKLSQSELLNKLKNIKPKVKLISIQPSSLNDRYVGGTEKNIQKLWEAAKNDKNDVVTIIFMDEIESFLSKRKEENSEHSTNVKSEFLCMLDGFRCKLEDKIIFIGATNLPKSLDEAFLRRFHTKILFKVPQAKERKQLIESFLIYNECRFTDSEINKLVDLSDGLSQSQIARIFSDAADFSDETSYNADFEEIEILLQNIRAAGNNIEAELAEINVQTRGMEENYIFLNDISL